MAPVDAAAAAAADGKEGRFSSATEMLSPLLSVACEDQVEFPSVVSGGGSQVHSLLEARSQKTCDTTYPRVGSLLCLSGARGQYVRTVGKQKDLSASTFSL